MGFSLYFIYLILWLRLSNVSPCTTKQWLPYAWYTYHNLRNPSLVYKVVSSLTIWRIFCVPLSQACCMFSQSFLFLITLTIIHVKYEFEAPYDVIFSSPYYLILYTLIFLHVSISRNVNVGLLVSSKTWRWRAYSPPKRRYLPSSSHGVTTRTPKSISHSRVSLTSCF
jgi:hypothetical protein